jgi:glutamyl-tRNA synthetase
LDPKDSLARVQKGEKYVIRLNVQEEGTTKFQDVIRGEVSFENKLLDDQVLLKSDGFPTYHLGVVVDDHVMKISHIIRGEEWISSTPKHVLLYQFFGWELPVFAHMPLLRNPDKSKLSKRKNPVWVSWFREEGFLPEAILNYLASLAWAHPEEKELFTVEEMMRVFELTQIQTTAPIFSVEKLRWFNGEYLRQKSDEELASLIKSFYDKELTPEKVALLHKILPLVKERMKTLKEFESLAGFFFDRPTGMERPLKKDLIELLGNILQNCEWNHDSMEQAIRKVADDKGLKAKDIFMELRVAVTGKTVGPPLLESLEVLGKEETMRRIT